MRDCSNDSDLGVETSQLKSAMEKKFQGNTGRNFYVGLRVFAGALFCGEGYCRCVTKGGFLSCAIARFAIQMSTPPKGTPVGVLGTIPRSHRDPRSKPL